ncbi:MAG: Gfo/Idh/MocA family oxidoreductase [Kiritimatiellae bacterium]|nr:Gfo/Idh/MocA family oxidoreductase [Kiritimatiellia bacterium]
MTGKITELMTEANSRRGFIKKTAAAGLTAAVASRGLAQGANTPTIKIGVVGCGGRGGFIASLFKAHGGYEIIAVGDYFQDKADEVGEKYSVPVSHRFTGLNNYKKVLEAKPDALVITSPPFFHPEQAASAVDAGIHVYVAKPVAVDVPGTLLIEATSKKATAKKLTFLVDFQTRSQPFFVEALKRVHEGAIGDIAFGEAYYHCNRLKLKVPPADDSESRLRNWVFMKNLSGDIINEQNIHTLDVMSWAMNKPPLHAVGGCARKTRVDVGDCNDCFALQYQYPDCAGVTFSSRQFNGYGTQPDGIVCRIFGSKGVLETKYGGQVLIRGENFYRGGETKQIYKEGVSNNIAAFHKMILEGDVSNATTAPSVRSNLVTIMGRTAAYTGKVVTWDEIMKDTSRMQPNLAGLKS